MRPSLAVLVLVLARTVTASATPLLDTDAARDPRAAVERLAPRPAELLLHTVTPLAGGGSLVRYQRWLGGVPVRGAGAVVRTGPAGEVQWTVASPRRGDVDPVPELDAARASHLAGGPVLVEPGLEVLLVPGGARLTWRVAVASFPPVARWIDAHTGELVREESLARDNTTGRLARVYLDNPVKTPGLTELDFGPDLVGTGDKLLGDEVDAMSCIDTRSCMTRSDGSQVHACALVHGVAPDNMSTFLAYLRPQSDADPTDGFAELQIFHHVRRALAAFHALGFAGLSQRPLKIVANFQTAGAACTDGRPPLDDLLEPWDNAAFISRGGFSQAPMEDVIIFGQGESVDFAYDGDVGYHELTHGVMFTLTPELPYGPTFDERGADWTTGGMHEGLADYFSATITGDPDLGEYTGRAFDQPSIRSLDSTYTCPESLIGEVHRDGQAFSSGLWQARQRLPEATRPLYDRAIFNVVASLLADDDQLSAGARMVAELRTVAGQEAADELAAELEARGFTDCQDRLFAPADNWLDRAFYNRTSSLSVEPGAVQLRLSNPAPAARLHVRAQRADGDGRIFLLARPGDQPITWTYDGGVRAMHDAPISGLVALHDPTPDDDQPAYAEGSIEGPFPAGPVVVQFAYSGSSRARMVDIQFEFTDGALPDAGPMIDPGPGDDDGGCGCAVGGQSRSGGAAILLGLAVVGLLRRRR